MSTRAHAAGQSHVRVFSTVRSTLRRTRLAAALALAFAASEAPAVTLYWDTNTFFSGTGGTQTWRTGTDNWAPVETGIVLVNAQPTSVKWPVSPVADGVFGGTAGTVTVDGTVNAGSMDFRTNGYFMTGGTVFLSDAAGTDGGSIFLGQGVTATIASGLDAPEAFGARRVFVNGPGTLVMANPSHYTGYLVVRNGAVLRPKEVDSLAGTFVFLEASAGKLDFGGLSTASVGDIVSLVSLQLGDTQLQITSGGQVHGTSLLQGGVSGSGTSGIVVGTLDRDSLSIGSKGSSGTIASMGFLHLNAGDSFIHGANVTLTQAGSTGFSGRSSLFLEAGTSLSVDGGAVLSLSGTPQLHNDAVLSVSEGSRISVIRASATPDAPASLRVGYAGGTSQLLLSGAGTVVESADLVQIGNDSFAPNPGVGLVEVGSGSVLRAPVLAFGTAESSLVVKAGGSAQFQRFDSRDGFNRAGTLRIDGGEFLIGDGLQSTLDTGASVFSGALTGGSGVFAKVGAGETGLTSNASDFAGTVAIRAGKLTVAPGALKNALLTMEPGATLSAPLATLDARLHIGALTGNYDLDLANVTILLGGGDHTATWEGRFTAGNVIVQRQSGAGVQIFTGGTEDAPFTALSLTTSGGSFRLDGGHFVFTTALPSNAVTNRTSLFADGTSGRIEIANGAQVSAGTGVRIHNGGRIVVSGEGSRLDITPGSNGLRSAFIGQFGGGTLEVADGATVTGSHFVLGQTSEPDSTSTLLVAKGGRLEASDFIQFAGRQSGLTIDQGTAKVGQFFIHDLNTFAGVIRLSDPAVPAGGNRLTAPAALTLTPTFQIQPDATFTIVDGPSGPGSLAFVGTNFSYRLRGTLGYTGRTIVDGAGAQVFVGSALASRDLIARNGGRLELQNLGSWDASRTTLRTETGGQIAIVGTDVVGGTLRGSGYSASTSTFDGTSLAVNAHMTLGPGVIWSNAQLQGAIDTFHGTGFDNVTVSTSGSLTVHLAASLSDVENNGLLELRDGAGVQVLGGLASGGGSRIVVGTGALLAGDTISLNGALLKNNGTVSAPLVINYLGMAKGGGTFGDVTVNDGGTFSPGNSPGTVHTGSVTLNEGGRYEVEVSDASGEPGIGFDLWDIAGTLTVNAGTTANTQFVVSLLSLDTGNAPGLAANFDQDHSFVWTVLRADSVTGFDPDEVRLDTTGFENDADGHFGLRLAEVAGRSELQIVYQPVPEPEVNALMAAGLAVMAAWRARRRRV